MYIYDNNRVFSGRIPHEINEQLRSLINIYFTLHEIEILYFRMFTV